MPLTVTADATQSWIRRFHPAPSAPVRLVCFPHAGGAASFFFPLSQALRDQVEVLCVQYPGRHERRREPLIDDIGRLADGIAEALDPCRGEQLAFFGHSMGAVIAYEVGRRFLGREPGAPLRLFASGRRAPSVYRADMRGEGDEALLADVRELDGTDSELLEDEELLRLALPVLRNDYRAVAAYRCPPGPVLSCPVTVLTGDSDPKVTEEEAMAWKDHTAGDFEVLTYRGGHFYLTERWQDIASAVRTRLAGV
ncbi:MAG: thioesterase [Streptomyces sp.]|nr:thioesterase [Streptomyces sp.]